MTRPEALALSGMLAMPAGFIALCLASVGQLLYVADHRLEPPPERLCTSVYRSAPGSLWLRAHEPGEAHYRFPEVRVRGGTRYRLRFHFLVARGGGLGVARLAMYEDTPQTWRSVGSVEIPLTAAGRWVAVDRVVTTAPACTAAAVDFCVDDPGCGEVFVDDVSLAPVGGPVTRGP